MSLASPPWRTSSAPVSLPETAGLDSASSTVLRTMNVADLDAVLEVEARAYSFPWSRGNFIDSLAAGYHAQVLSSAATGELLGYLIAQPGVDELHLLNLTVSPDHQRHGHARQLLDALEAHARERALATLWLEVRAGNVRAREIYRVRGFAEVGLRRAYYPAAASRREDAVVMSLALHREAADAAR